MRDQCVIFYGLIQMTAVVGAYLLVVLATLLGRIYPSNSTYCHFHLILLIVITSF
jgi:hypothetical protein